MGSQRQRSAQRSGRNQRCEKSSHSKSLQLKPRYWQPKYPIIAALNFTVQLKWTKRSETMTFASEFGHKREAAGRGMRVGADPRARPSGELEVLVSATA